MKTTNLIKESETPKSVSIRIRREAGVYHIGSYPVEAGEKLYNQLFNLYGTAVNLVYYYF